MSRGSAATPHRLGQVVDPSRSSGYRLTASGCDVGIMVQPRTARD